MEVAWNKWDDAVVPGCRYKVTTTAKVCLCSAVAFESAVGGSIQLKQLPFMQYHPQSLPAHAHSSPLSSKMSSFWLFCN
eukprot:COSAG05_NODE_899_length_6679_cov_4.328419_2_plen_79_part_00